LENEEVQSHAHWRSEAEARNGVSFIIDDFRLRIENVLRLISVISYYL
jgi:hypothetical protein